MVGSVAKQRGFSIHSADTPEPNIILDIDEDYFATGDTILPLMAAGWTNTTLSQVDAVLLQLCSPSEQAEHFLAKQIEACIKKER
jgi:hypothetical protein